LLKTCDRIPQMDANWVWEVNEQGVSFQPIWPRQHMGALWSGVPRVILMSATLRPYTLGLCGLKPEQYDFREWPAVFLPQLGPVYHLPTVKLSWKSTDEDYKQLVEQVDAVLDARSDRKGIVQTVSYSRARRVLEASRHAHRFIWNDSGRTANDANERFRNGRSSAVLVSPSFGTGFDFPGKLCEFQIILKVPYPNTQSRVTAERCKSGEYRMYSAVQDLVQMCGRGRRYPEDRCENFVLDDSVKWAMGGPRNPWHGHAPSWFKCQTIGSIPPAPPRVGAGASR
jgi:Rad3-related DNA helicase